jgi:methylmalonyl-CoA mutase C-terminal domain/subunit
MILAPEVVKLLHARGAGDIAVVLGGTVPPDDVALLKEAGIAEVFGPGTPLEKIIGFIAGIERT